MIEKTTPDGNENGCRNDGTDEWDTAQVRLTGNVEVQDANNHENGEKSQDDGANDTIRRTPTRYE